MSYFKGSRFPVPQTLLDRVGIPFDKGEFMRFIVKEMSLADLINHPKLPNTHAWVEGQKAAGVDVKDNDIMLYGLAEVMGSPGIIEFNENKKGQPMYAAMHQVNGFDESLGFNRLTNDFWIGNIEDIKDKIELRKNSQIQSLDWKY